MQQRFTRGILLGVCCLVFVPALSSAQSAIVRLVTDSQGGVLPGVTVEASSPALIEGARTVVTDGQGRYRVAQLRPGAYNLESAVRGFAGGLREGINLPAELTATVNAAPQV